MSNIFELQKEDIEILKSRGRGRIHKRQVDMTTGYTSDDPLVINLSGRFIIFETLPATVNVRFNETDEPQVAVTVRKKLYTPFYRFFIDFAATNTTEKLTFYVSDDFDISDVNVMFNNKDLLAYATPLGLSATPYTSSAFAIFEYSKVTYNIMSNVDGTLEIQFSSDLTNWDKISTIPVTGGIAAGDVIEVTNRYVRAVFTKLNSSDNQTTFRLTLRARVN